MGEISPRLRTRALNDEDVLLFSHPTISMKHHLTETHKQACKIRNIVSTLQSIFSGKYDQLHHVTPLSGTSPTNHRLTHDKAAVTFFEGGGGGLIFSFLFLEDTQECLPIQGRIKDFANGGGGNGGGATGGG